MSENGAQLFSYQKLLRERPLACYRRSASWWSRCIRSPRSARKAMLTGDLAGFHGFFHGDTMVISGNLRCIWDYNWLQCSDITVESILRNYSARKKMSCHWRNRSRKGLWLSQKTKGVPCYVPARKYLCLEVWPGTDWFRTQTASQARPQQKDTAAVGIKKSLLMWGQNQNEACFYPPNLANHSQSAQKTVVFGTNSGRKRVPCDSHLQATEQTRSLKPASEGPLSPAKLHRGHTFSREMMMLKVGLNG